MHAKRLLALLSLITISYTAVAAAAAFLPSPSSLLWSARRHCRRHCNRIPLSSTSTTATTTSMTMTMTTSPLQEYGFEEPLLLGSASFTRKLILKEMGIPFLKLVRPIDEKALGDRTKIPPSDLVLLLGKAKMDHLVQELKAGNCNDDLIEKSVYSTTNSKDSNIQSSFATLTNSVVLTGDQVVVTDTLTVTDTDATSDQGGPQEQILEKPESVQQAKEFVSQYKTHPPSTVGSVVLTHLPTGIQVSGVDTATIHFRSSLPANELVDALLEQGEPILSCAGGLMVEHPLVKEHIERIDGTEDSVMGLSKDLVLKLLKELSIAVKAQTQNS